MKKFIFIMCVVTIILTGCSESSSVVEQETRGEIRIRGGYSDNFAEDTAQLEYMRDFTQMPVDWVPGPLENPLDKLMLELGSKEDYNMVSVSYAEIGPVIEQNLALDLTDYASLAPNVVAGIDSEDWEVCKDPESGAIYCIPSMQGTSHIINTTIYRKDILEKEGLAVPATTDELLNTTCELTKKGYKRPWAINWESAVYDYGVRQAFSVGWEFNYDDSGKLVYMGMDQRYYDFLDWAKAMYDCGGYGSDYETVTQEDRNASFINGDSVFMTSPWWESKAQAEGFETASVNYEDAVGVVDLTGPNGNKMYEQEGNGGYNFLFIPKYMEKYAKESAEFLNKVYEEEYIMQTRYGVEGVSYTKNEEGVAVKDTTQTVAYPEPYKCANENCGYEYYVLGNPNAMLREELAAEDQFRVDKVNSGEGTPNDIATVAADQFLEFGNPDPTGPMVVAPLWNKAEMCATNTVNEFSDLYIVGKKTKDDIEGLKTQLDKCGVTQATEEVNAWAEKYYE